MVATCLVPEIAAAEPSKNRPLVGVCVIAVAEDAVASVETDTSRGSNTGTAHRIDRIATPGSGRRTRIDVRQAPGDHHDAAKRGQAVGEPFTGSGACSRGLCLRRPAPHGFFSDLSTRVKRGPAA